MNPITSARDIQIRLSGDSSPHKELVDIASFAATHPDEVMSLGRSDKNKLYSRLVLENYNNEELETVVSVAERFFKERVAGNLEGLSSVAKLHLFRCTEPSQLEMPAHALTLLRMSKARRELETYSALLKSLLSQRLEGRALNLTLQECLIALRSIPENEREERLAVFKKGLKVLPSLTQELAELLSINLKSLEALSPYVANCTNGNKITAALKAADAATLVNLKSFRAICPMVEDDIGEQLQFANSSDLPTLKTWVEAAPALSKSTTIAELKNILSCSKEWQPKFKQIVEAFPKLNFGFDLLLRWLIKMGAEQFLAEKDTEPFSTITSGEVLGFMVYKLTQDPKSLPRIKQFCAAFPNLQKNVEKLFFSTTQFNLPLLDSFKENDLHKLPMTDGNEINRAISSLIVDLIDEKLSLFIKCVVAYPLITDYCKLLSMFVWFKGEKIKDLKLLMATPGISFKDVNDLERFISKLNGLSYFQVFYWGGKAELLISFKKDVLDRFPRIESDLDRLLDCYTRCDFEVWEFLRESYAEEKSGCLLSAFAQIFELKRFKDAAERRSTLRLYLRLANAFPQISYIQSPKIETLQNGLTLLDQTLKFAPHLCSLSNIPLYELLANLAKVEESQREHRLALLQKHLENCEVYPDIDVNDLFAIPVEEQEDILAFCLKFDTLGIKKYTTFIKNLKELSRTEREALFSNILDIFPASQARQLAGVTLDYLLSIPKNWWPAALINFKTLISLKPSISMDLSLLTFMPNSVLVACFPKSTNLTNLYGELAAPENKEAICTHIIALLEDCEHNAGMLKLALIRAEYFKNLMRLGDDESPLGQTIIRYQTILSDEGAVTPWTIYEGHKARLASAEKLPFPMLDKMHFNYERLLSTTKITLDMLPEGIDFAKLEALVKAFAERYRKLDELRQTAILSYINTILEKQFSSADEIVQTINDPWWGNNLNTHINPISTTSWKLFKAVDAISKESDEAGNQLPGEEESEENFLIKERLLSPREISLIRLLGQVQNCPAGKEWGLDNYVSAKELSIADGPHAMISEAIINHLDAIISSDRFLQKLLNRATVSEPLHHAKYIRNVLSKELKFPLLFDAHTGAISNPLLEIDPQKLLTAVFKAVSPSLLYHAIAIRLNTMVWKSQEGGKLYQALINEIPSEKLDECCKFDQEYSFAGITEKAVPYLLKHYGFFAM